MKSFSFTQLFALLFTLFAVLLAGSTLFAWTGPTATAPAGNVSAPVNVGTTDQVKNAGLSVNALAVFGSGYIQNKLGIGTNSPGAGVHVSGTSGEDGIYIGTVSAAPNTSPNAIEMWNNLGLTVAGNAGLREIETDYNGVFRIERPQTVASVPDFVITPAGRVGINSYSPSAQLEVQTSSGIALNVIDSANSYGIYSSISNAGGVAVDGDNTSTGARGALGYANYGVYCIVGLCGGGNAWNSDARLKRDIAPLAPSDVLTKLMQLTPVSFHWKDAKQDALEGEKFGFIAQDVQKVFPNVVVDTKTAKTITPADGSTTTIPDVLSLDYTDLIPLSVLGVQELTKEVSAQQKEIDELKAEIAALKAAR